MTNFNASSIKFLFILGIYSFTTFAQQQRFSLPVPEEQYASALILAADDMKKIPQFEDMIISNQGYETNHFEAIRVYPVNGYPNYVYFWHCKNVHSEHLAQPTELEGNEHCYPLVFKNSSLGKPMFYFDYTYSEANHSEYCIENGGSITNLAAFELSGLRASEQKWQRAKNAYDLNVTILSLPLLFRAGWVAGEKYIIPAANRAGAYVLSKAMTQPSRLSQLFGGFVIGYMGDVSAGMFGLGLISDVLLTGISEEIALNGFLSRSGETDALFKEDFLAVSFMPIGRPGETTDEYAVRAKSNNRYISPVQNYAQHLTVFFNGMINSISGYYMIHHKIGSPHNEPALSLFSLEMQQYGHMTNSQTNAIQSECQRAAQEKKCQWYEIISHPESGAVKK